MNSSVIIKEMYPASEGWMIQVCDEFSGEVIERYNISCFALIEKVDDEKNITKERKPCINLNGNIIPFIKKCSVIYIPSIYGGGF